MQLPDKSGIACDRCGTSYRNDFNYYSLDLRPASPRSSLDEILASPCAKSFDVCPACFEAVKAAVVTNWPKQGRRLRVCEISSQPIPGDYYHVAVTAVNVRSLGQP